jgi:hypothetical protein
MSHDAGAFVAMLRGGHDGPRPHRLSALVVSSGPGGNGGKRVVPADGGAEITWAPETQALWRDLLDRLDTAEREVRRLRGELSRAQRRTSCDQRGTRFGSVTDCARHVARCKVADGRA